jgi:hypothetical protein
MFRSKIESESIKGMKASYEDWLSEAKRKQLTGQHRIKKGPNIKLSHDVEKSNELDL